MRRARPRNRPRPACRAALDRAAGRGAVHRRADARRRPSRRVGAQRARACARRSTSSARRSPSPTRPRRSRGATTPRCEAIAADGLDANVSIKLTGFGLKLDPELCRSLVARARPRRRRPRDLRPDRHGGLERPPTTTLELYRVAARAGTRRGRRRPPGGAAAHARRHRGARAAPAERPAVQGDLPRAAVHRLPGVRGDPRELRRLPRRAARRRRAGRRSRRTTSGCIERALERVAGLDRDALRAADAARRARRPRARARRRGAPAPGLRPVRAAVVRVLAPPAPGEPEGRRLRRDTLPETVSRAGGRGQSTASDRE